MGILGLGRFSTAWFSFVVCSSSEVIHVLCCVCLGGRGLCVWLVLVGEDKVIGITEGRREGERGSCVHVLVDGRHTGNIYQGCLGLSESMPHVHHAAGCTTRRNFSFSIILLAYRLSAVVPLLRCCRKRAISSCSVCLFTLM